MLVTLVRENQEKLRFPLLLNKEISGFKTANGRIIVKKKHKRKRKYQGQSMLQFLCVRCKKNPQYVYTDWCEPCIYEVSQLP